MPAVTIPAERIAADAGLGGSFGVVWPGLDSLPDKRGEIAGGCGDDALHVQKIINYLFAAK